MRGFFEKKPLKLPKKLSNFLFVPCVPSLFYGKKYPQNRAPTPSFGTFSFYTTFPMMVQQNVSHEVWSNRWGRLRRGKSAEDVHEFIHGRSELFPFLVALFGYFLLLLAESNIKRTESNIIKKSAEGM